MGYSKIEEHNMIIYIITDPYEFLYKIKQGETLPYLKILYPMKIYPR